MDGIVAALGAEQAELSRLLDGLHESDWERPSRCTGWTVADVVLHLAQTNELAVGSATGRFAETVDELTRGAGPAASIDEGADVMVARQRGEPGPAVGKRWQTSAETLRQVLRDCDPHQRVVWVAGELSAQTLATTRLAETWIHSGDVAAALGVAVVPSDRLWHIARLAWRTLPYAFTRAERSLSGPVALALQSPGGEVWDFVPDSEPLSHVRGEAMDLCLVAARRVDPSDTTLVGEGPDADAVLELIRTYA